MGCVDNQSPSASGSNHLELRNTTKDHIVKDSFVSAWQAVDTVDGWLTEAQARRYFDAVSSITPSGQVVEIGSYHGRSVIVAALACATSEIEVVAIDPHAGNDRGPREWDGTESDGNSDHRKFLDNLAMAQVDHLVRHVREFSDDALDDVPGAIDVLYIDGAHRFAPAASDIKHWGERVADGGTLLMHDAYSSVGVTLALARRMWFNGNWSYVGRSGSMVQYRKQRLTWVQRPANIARQLLPLGWFTRNLVVKTAIVLKQPWLARLLGHDGATWPY
jgi:predicted O-methyltransferase YrrM